ncbi:hypothetical protein EXU57_04790 [Segetibacter sp. 3557_3]|nr:hypothetical protein EXU57_04790 [Segetibacter sp. 3557_3]
MTLLRNLGKYLPIILLILSFQANAQPSLNIQNRISSKILVLENANTRRTISREPFAAPPLNSSTAVHRKLPKPSSRKRTAVQQSPRRSQQELANGAKNSKPANSN